MHSMQHSQAEMHHYHAHAHSHSAELGPLSMIGLRIFQHDPLSNAVLAVTIVTGITQLLIASSPPLSGLVLQFLVAFAEGGALGAIFVHILPETNLDAKSGLLIIFGFLLFVGVDKIMRILASQTPTDSQGHSHSHSQGHSHSHTHSHSSPSSSTSQSEKPTKSENGITMQNIGPLLNVVADSLHNLTDGIALAMAFHQGALPGISAFIVMCCHEIPHQFGDFALLINSGTPKSAARKLQLVTALGTLMGCLLGNWLGSFGAVLDGVVTPLTVGVLLYVATMSILPELLETDPTKTRMAQAGESIVQLIGIVTGITLLLVLEH